MKINRENESEVHEEKETLSICCFDTIETRARVTFDACEINGMNITYWMDDSKDVQERIKSIFAILFEDMIKNMVSNQK
jgi:hypothetical protein